MTGPWEDRAAAEGLAAVTELLATARSNDEDILVRVTATLSRLMPGLWVASLMGRDPTNAKVFTADRSQPLLADYVDQYLATAYGPGRAPITGVTKSVVDTGRPVLIPRLSYSDFMPLVTSTGQDYLRSNQLPYELEQPSVSALVVPMRARAATIGTLGVFGANDTASFTERDVTWMQDVADRIGLAVESVQSHAAAVRRHERLNALHTIAEAMTSDRDIRLTLKLLLEHLTARLPVDAADVLIYNQDQDDFQVASCSGFHSTSMPDYRLPAGFDGPHRSQLIIEIADMSELPALERARRRSLFAREGFTGYRGVPLLVRNRVRGRLEVFHRSDFEPDQEQLTYLELIATMAAMAIDMAASSDRFRERSGQPPATRARQPAPELTRIEQEVLKRLVEGMTNAAIAAAVNRAENTVRFYVRRLLRKAGAANRTELARIATREGWI